MLNQYQTSSPATSKIFIASLNSHKYYFKITISNGDKATPPLELSYYMVEDLQIEETLFNWFAFSFYF